jgi:molybdopterin synthase catalytic subunit
VRRDIRVQEADFDLSREFAVLREATGAAAGAIVAFCGVVRDRHDLSDVQELFLEHYPGMTERSIDAILDRASQRWNLDAVQVLHRVGRLVAGDQIVLVLVASAHRTEAFEACEFVMDYLKTDAIFWKREMRAGDLHWIAPTGDDQRRRDTWREERG